MQNLNVTLTKITTLLILMLSLLIVSPAVAREKIDVITLTNGDRITGEVRQLDLGKVTLKTDAMGTVTIEWDQVKKLQSTQIFEVENEDGEKYYGFITEADEEGRFLILSQAGPVIALKHDRIVRIESIEDSWRDRWRGFIDFGLSYLSANSAASISLGSEATYRSKKFEWQTSLISIFSDRDDAARTSWTTLNNSYTRFHGNRWFGTGYQRYESNEDTQLDFRFTVGGGLGRYVIQTNRTQLGLLAGFAGNREQYFGAETESESESEAWTADAVFSATYEFFVFGDRETRVTASFEALPSITNWGRYRLEFSSSLRRELFNDFTLNLTIFDTYDSDPPVEDVDGNVTRNDIRVQTTLGWTF